MPARKKGLGRGLGALIKDETPTDTPVEKDDEIRKLPVEIIKKNEWQPRRDFEESSLSELADSIKEHGVLQPLLVRPSNDEFELIAGERRLRAAGMAGLTEVPVVVIDATDGDSLEMALIENLQRENLNIVEEAEGYKDLADKFNLTQEQIADRMSKSRASITNAMRILTLPDEVLIMLSDNRISAGHAKVLLSLEISDEQILFARRIVSEALSVRNLEKVILKSKATPRKARAVKIDMPSNHITYLTDKLHTHFGTSVRLTPCRTFANGKKGKGTIELDFFTNDDLDRILSLLGITEE
ncbi:ParB/RepB/Spo0J family partition protein [PVC group bacterium]|nr:ParB/RepB/Spo0J family partition protein [PVC group bacterium]